MCAFSLRPVSIYATESDPKLEALNEGAAWIISKQLPSGGWTEYRDPGATSLALSALIAHANYLGFEPTEDAYVYSDNVKAALEYIFLGAIRDEDNGYVHWTADQIYVLGPVLMAITSIETPEAVIDLEGSALDGMTHLEVVQEIVNFIELAQVKSGPGIGLWYYYHPTSSGDMSISGWITLGLGYAKEKFGIVLSPSMLDYLDEGLDIVIWDDDPNHELYGGAGYSSGSTIEDSYRGWINIHKVGHLLSMLELVGDPISSWRVQAALGFIERHFNAPNSGLYGTSFEWPSLVNDYIDVGWRGDGESINPSYIAMISVMKGLLAYGIEVIDVDDEDVNWHHEFESVILTTQDSSGFWQNGGYPYSTVDTYRVYYTAWAMMVLLRSVPTIAVTGIQLTCFDRPLSIDGGTQSILFQLRPADATNTKVDWTSSNPDVATVDNGVVTPIGLGSTLITATTDDGEFSQQCNVVISDGDEDLPPTADSSVALGWLVLLGLYFTLLGQYTKRE